MARRAERRGPSIPARLATWAALALIVIWAARNPAQAAALARHIAAALASIAAHLTHARSTTP